LFDYHALGNLPDKPHYKDFRIAPFRERFIVPASGETSHTRCTSGVSFRTPEDFLAFRESRATLIFYGYVRFKGIFKRARPRILGFGYYWEFASNALIPIGGTEYNYEREENENQE